MKLELVLEDGAIGPFRVGGRVDDFLKERHDVERFDRGREQFVTLYDSNVQMSVDESGLVRFVEVFAPIIVAFKGDPLTGRDLAKAEKKFKVWGLHRVLGSDGFFCLAKSCVVASQNGRIVSSVAVFREGYYDGMPFEPI